MIEDALADTSVFIDIERSESNEFPDVGRIAVSVVTIGELRAGVLLATDPVRMALRLRTLNQAEMADPIPIDESVADAWSELRVASRRAGHTLSDNDSWIAATAITHGLPLLTADSDFERIPDLEVVKI